MEGHGDAEGVEEGEMVTEDEVASSGGGDGGEERRAKFRDTDDMLTAVRQGGRCFEVMHDVGKQTGYGLRRTACSAYVTAGGTADVPDFDTPEGKKAPLPFRIFKCKAELMSNNTSRIAKDFHLLVSLSMGGGRSDIVGFRCSNGIDHYLLTTEGYDHLKSFATKVRTLFVS